MRRMSYKPVDTAADARRNWWAQGLMELKNLRFLFKHNMDPLAESRFIKRMEQVAAMRLPKAVGACPCHCRRIIFCKIFEVKVRLAMKLITERLNDPLIKLNRFTVNQYLEMWEDLVAEMEARSDSILLKTMDIPADILTIFDDFFARARARLLSQLRVLCCGTFKTTEYKTYSVLNMITVSMDDILLEIEAAINRSDARFDNLCCYYNSCEQCTNQVCPWDAATPGTRPDHCDPALMRDLKKLERKEIRI
jgi:hypothetical protein